MVAINFYNMNNNLTPFRLLVKNARFPDLLAGALLFNLGAGLDVYLGGQINWSNYFLGQGCITMLQLSAYFLKYAFDLPMIGTRVSSILDDDIRQQSAVISRNAVLLAAATTLAMGAVFTVILLSNLAFSPISLVILGLGLSLALLYGIPPFRLVHSGYGELAQAILVANLAPALALIIQRGELHSLLATLTFPLTALHIALQLALSLPAYARDERFQYRNMMVRLGWSNGMNLHNLLILFAYLFLVISSFISLPWVLLRPALLTLPIGLFQIWQMLRLTCGAKPNWVLLTITSIATFALTAYFITFTLWTS